MTIMGFHLLRQILAIAGCQLAGLLTVGQPHDPVHSVLWLILYFPFAPTSSLFSACSAPSLYRHPAKADGSERRETRWQVPLIPFCGRMMLDVAFRAELTSRDGANDMPAWTLCEIGNGTC